MKSCKAWERVRDMIGKNKQKHKRGERRPLCDKYGRMFLGIMSTAVILSGCAAVQSKQIKDIDEQAKDTAKQEKDTAEKTDSPSQKSQDTSQQAALQAGTQKITPDISYAEQIDTILDNKDMWCFTMPEDAPEEYGENEADYHYWITDLDQNGYLEVIQSSTTGNGGDYYNQYYEVCKDGTGLTVLSQDEDAPSPDLWAEQESQEGYYDLKTGMYHYPKNDHTHGSAIDTSDAALDMVLSDGKININTLYFVETESYGKRNGKDYGCITKYYAGEKEEKLGELKEPYDEKKDDFIGDAKLQSEYNAALDKLDKQYYEGMQEFSVTFGSFRTIDEKKYKKSYEIAVVSDEAFRKRVEESWNCFGIHAPE